MVRRNILANLAGGAWTGLVGLICVPMYLRLVGAEAFGLIGVFTTMQALFGLLDLGLKNTVNREFARLTTHSDTESDTRDVLRTVELPYWAMGGGIGAVILFLAPIIANRWVNADALSIWEIERAVALMGLVIALRWPLSIYSGGLQGLQQQVLLNTVNGTAATIRGFGAVLVLWLVSPTIVAFFVWQGVVSLGHTLALAFLTWRSLPQSDSKPHFRLAIVQRIWRFAIGVSGATVLTVMLAQLDKVILSRMLTLEHFGYYSVASVMALSLYRLIHPVFVAVYPKLTSLLELGAEQQLKKLYHRAAQLIAATAVPAAVVAAAYSRELLLLWTQDIVVAQYAHQVASILVVATAIHGLTNVPYALQLAAGWPSLSFYINLSSATVLIPAMLILAQTHGAVGVALAWMAFHLIHLVVSIHVMHRRLLVGEMRLWYVNEVVRPAAAACIVVLAARLILPPPMNHVLLVGYLACVFSGAMLITAYVMPETRSMLQGQMARLRHALT